MKKIIDTCGEPGLILLVPSGVFYTNQAGGIACDHPEAEGVFMPWPFSPNYISDIEDHLASWYGGLDDKKSEEINGLLPSEVKVDKDMLDDSMEAWVYVTMPERENNKHWSAWSGFDAPLKAIMVWENSD